MNAKRLVGMRRRALVTVAIVVILCFGVQLFINRFTSPLEAQGTDGLYWSSDFEGPAFEGGKLGLPDYWLGTKYGLPSSPTAECATGGPTEPSTPLMVKQGNAAHGTSALHVYVRPMDQPAPGDCDKHKNRVEIIQSGTKAEDAIGVGRTHSSFGETAYYRAGFLLPSDANLNPSNYNITLQFHGLGVGDNPNVRIGFVPLSSGKYTMQVYANGGDLFTYNVPGAELRADVAQVSPNVWTEVILGVHWDHRPYQGWVEAYTRTALTGSWTQVLSRKAVATLYQENGQPVSSYLRVGLYRGSASDTAAYAGVSHVVIDYVLAGPTLESVRQDAAPPPPCTNCGNSGTGGTATIPKSTSSSSASTTPGTSVTTSDGEGEIIAGDLNGDSKISQEEVAAAGAGADKVQRSLLSTFKASHLYKAASVLAGFALGIMVVGLFLYLTLRYRHKYMLEQFDDENHPAFTPPSVIIRPVV